jgi:AAA+ superfamily predicted ATPase
LKNVEVGRGRAAIPDNMLVHLTDIVRNYASELVGYQEMQNILDEIRKIYPVVVDEVMEYISIGEITKIIKKLLDEKVWIYNIVDILEVLSYHGRINCNIPFLVEMVRQRLGRQISIQHAIFDGNKKYVLHAVTLDEDLEKMILSAKSDTVDTIECKLEDEKRDKILDAIKKIFIPSGNVRPVILCSQNTRYLMRDCISRAYPNIPVLSVNEIPNDVTIEPYGKLTLAGEFDSENKYSGKKINALDELNELIGLTEVKEKVHEIKRIIERKGRDSLPCLHMVFRGNPGTGKTTVARLVGKIFAELGVLPSKDIFIETDRQGLVAKYVGQTAIKTAAKIKQAYGGVLFIDEADTLGSYRWREDFGHECIATLVKRMEDNRKDFVCIMAGYTKEMDIMLNVNPGLKDRIQFYIDFPDYSAEELVLIFRDLCGKNGLVIEKSADESLLRLFSKIIAKKDKHFSNGRITRKIFERVKMQHILRSDDNEIQNIDIELACQSKDIAAAINGTGEKQIGFRQK